MPRLTPPHVERLVPYVPGKPVEEVERELGIADVVKLASNESPFGPSPHAVEVLRRIVTDAHRYPDAAGYELRHALAAFHGVKPDEIALGNGSNELINLLALTFAGPDEHAVTGNPSFVCYRMALNAANVPLTEVALRDGLHWDVDSLLAAVRPDTKLLFVANPNNPTGTYLARGELERLLRSLPPRVIAVLDEAYAQFATAADFASALQLRATRERLVVLRTFSKAYGLASLRVGYAVAPPKIVAYLDRVRAPFNVGGLAQAAARAALGDLEHVARTIENNTRERERVTRALEALGLRVAPSEANFVLVDVRTSGRAVYERMLQRGVIVRPMPAPIETWLRITIGVRDENDRMLATLREGVRT